MTHFKMEFKLLNHFLNLKTCFKTLSVHSLCESKRRIDQQNSIVIYLTFQTFIETALF